MMKKKKIQLIVPPFSEQSAMRGEERIDLIVDNAVRVYPPLGLCYLASSLAKIKEVEVKIIDSAAQCLNFNDIIEVIKVEEPLIIGITVTSFTLRSTYYLINKIRKHFTTNIIIVVGGAHITYFPQSVFDLGADYGFSGDSEFSFPKFVQQIISRNSVENISGLIWRQNGKLLVNSPEPIKELDSLPFPDRDIIDRQKYHFYFISGNFTTVITSRGCPFDCIFCGLPNQKRYLKRSIKNVIEEIKILKDKYYYISFADDILTLERNRVEELCARLLSEKINIIWGCQVRADNVDLDLFKVMKEAGCREVRFGVETGNERIRREIMGKDISNEIYIKAIGEAKRAGLETAGFFLFGSPQETLENMEETIAFSKKLGLDYASFLLATPIPGSRLFNIALSEGKFKRTVWKKVMEGKRETPIYTPDGVSLNQMKNMLRKAYAQFYLRPSYLARQLAKSENLNEIKSKIRTGINLLKDRLKIRV